VPRLFHRGKKRETLKHAGRRCRLFGVLALNSAEGAWLLAGGRVWLQATGVYKTEFVPAENARSDPDRHGLLAAELALLGRTRSELCSRCGRRARGKTGVPVWSTSGVVDRRA
jgi:hypothetical protein